MSKGNRVNVRNWKQIYTLQKTNWVGTCTRVNKSKERDIVNYHAFTKQSKIYENRLDSKIFRSFRGCLVDSALLSTFIYNG
jgi:hypothetical protein